MNIPFINFREVVQCRVLNTKFICSAMALGSRSLMNSKTTDIGGNEVNLADRQNQHTASVQVKFAKDFLPTMDADFQEPLRVCTWFTINRNKLHDSRADFWIFVLSGFKKHSRDFVVVPTAELQDRLMKIHGSEGKKMIHSYLWVTEDNRCWETRDLSKGDWRRIARNE
jgi:hypothetical protein